MNGAITEKKKINSSITFGVLRDCISVKVKAYSNRITNLRNSILCFKPVFIYFTFWWFMVSQVCILKMFLQIIKTNCEVTILGKPPPASELFGPKLA